MDKTTAIRKLSALLGKGFSYRENPAALDSAGRAEAREGLSTLTEAKQAASAAMEARKAALLAGDAEYQRLRAEFKAADTARMEISRKAHGYRITVGTVSNMAGFGVFSVAHEGDNWADVVAAVQAKKGK